MHDVVGAQQHVALAPRIGAGQGAFQHIAQVTEHGMNNHVIALLRDLGAGENPMTNEVGHEACRRPVVQLIGVGPLVQLAFMHDTNPVTDGKRFQLVVRDKQCGGTGLFQDAAYLMRQAFA